MDNNQKQVPRRGQNISNSLVLRHFWHGIKPYRWSFYWVLILLVAGNILILIAPLLYKQFFDVLTTASDPKVVVPTLVSIIVYVLLIQIVRWCIFQACLLLNVFFQTKVIAKLKQNAFDYLIDHSYSFFANNFTGSLTQRVNRFARAFERLVDRLFWGVIPIAISAIGMSVVLWFVKPVITVVLVIWVLVLLTFNFFFSQWRLKYRIQMAEADSRTTGVLSDAITNQNNIQLFTGQAYESSKFEDVTNDQAKISSFNWNLSTVVDGVQMALIIVVEFFLFYFAIRFWSEGLLTIGSFVLIQSYFLVLADKLWDFSRIIRDWHEAFADAKEMVDIMSTPHEVKDAPNAVPLVVRDGKIEFKDAVFSFNETREVLKDMNINIAGGEKVALIGPSGAGKSTFVRLLLRLYDVTAGAVLVDGQNVKDVTQESLRKELSLVPQDPILFHRSLKENIRYGKRDASDEEVLHAAKLAHCDEFIKDLPLGYDTLVGERGIKLSGGERQRVAIARAILKNAPILILDEATSSLDSESEHLIQDALEVLMKGKTVIVIAHRLSTIRKMDRIVVLEDGKIKEEGTHDSLLNQNSSLYKKLWTLQAGGFIAE